MAGHVSGRTGLQETWAVFDKESVATTISISQSKGKRDRDTNVVHSLKDRGNLHKILERKVDSAVRGERMAQQELYEAEAEVEARNWEKRRQDIALQEKNQEFESQRFQQHQESRWADQAHRDKISLYGQLGLTNRLFQEDHARDCQGIEELRRIFCEEASRARQARIDELFMHQERNPATVSQLTAQIRELQNKVNSLFDARAFYDPESGSSSGTTHVPDRTATIPSPRTLPRCDSGLPRNTLNGTGITGNVSERPSAQEGLSSTIYNNSKNSAHSLQGLRRDTTETARRESGMKNKSLNTPIQSPHFQSRRGMLNHTGGSCSHNGMMDYPRIPVTEWNLGKLI